MNHRELGSTWERVAAEYLVGRGMEILELNFRCRQGEVDIIGNHQGYLVFVEVKYRSTSEKGSAAHAITPAKMKRISRVAEYYRYSHHIGMDVPIRYDVVAIDAGEIHWIKNAFFHSY